MAKKELEEQLKSYEGYINDIPLVIDLARCVKTKTERQKKKIIGVGIVVGFMTVSLKWK